MSRQDPRLAKAGIPGAEGGRWVSQEEFNSLSRWISVRRHVELTLYGAVTLIGTILAIRVSEAVDTTAELVAAVWATAVGLAVAHWFAASVAARVSVPEQLPLGHYVDALWQSYPLVIAALVATGGAAIGEVFGDGVQVAARGADIALIGLCAVVAWGGASAHKAPYAKRITLTLFVVLFATVISGVKSVLGH